MVAIVPGAHPAFGEGAGREEGVAEGGDGAADPEDHDGTEAEGGPPRGAPCRLGRRFPGGPPRGQGQAREQGQGIYQVRRQGVGACR